MPDMFLTQRTKVVAAYQNAKQPFLANTKPYKSTSAFSFFAVNSIGNTALLAGSAAFYIARAGQRVEWFSYGLGGSVPGTAAVVFTPPGGTQSSINNSAGLVAGEDDTNLSKSRSTNGSEDFVIEGMSASARSVRAAYMAADITALTALLGSQTAGAAVGTDADITNYLNGLVPILDPGSLLLPPQVQSPINLENTLMTAIAPHVQIEFEWDRGRIEKIGTLDQIPEGAAKSFLRANGQPSTSERYRIPEGYLWRRDGQPDSEFVVRGTLLRSVLVPMSGILFPTAVAGTPTGRMPGIIQLDILVRLHGLSVKLPSGN